MILVKILITFYTLFRNFLIFFKFFFNNLFNIQFLKYIIFFKNLLLSILKILLAAVDKKYKNSIQIKKNNTNKHYIINEY
jgi:hypothetical protein